MQVCKNMARKTRRYQNKSKVHSTELQCTKAAMLCVKGREWKVLRRERERDGDGDRER